MGQEAAFNDSWLVMRGRNIRLQHQDHVRHALYGHRAATQSALPRYTERSRPRGSFSPTLLFNSMKGTLSPSPDIERCHNYQRTPLRCHSGKAATARPRHSAPAQAPAAKPSEVLKSNRTLVNTKSIVIRLPDSSRTSPWAWNAALSATGDCEREISFLFLSWSHLKAGVWRQNARNNFLACSRL